jgi:predicted Fe-S protein YdhL (DUF1289 family)
VSPEAPVASPCIEVCELDTARDVCTGCGRSLEEIAEWSRATNPRRREIRRLAQQRLATRNQNVPHG